MQKPFDHEFFQNRYCEYFPCHETDNPDSFNCHYCYCPLYILDDKCGGNFTYNAKGIKDCTACIRPHRPQMDKEFYENIRKVVSMIAEKHRKS